MARQERAEQTRHRIMEAAAAEFAAHGYAGTSLFRIATTAGVTMGAVTFHFRSKSELAGAVHEAGSAATRRVTDGVTGAALRDVLDEVLALAEALAGSPVMRAAARLAREDAADAADSGGSRPASWYDSWVPRLRRRLEDAWPAGESAVVLAPRDLATLLAHALIGIEAASASRAHLRAGTGADPYDSLTRVVAAVCALLPDTGAPGAESAVRTEG